MGAQYSTGILAADWKGWLEQRGSLESIRASYTDFQKLCASRNTSTNGNGEDGFFVTIEDFRQVRSAPYMVDRPYICCRSMYIINHGVTSSGTWSIIRLEEVKFMRGMQTTNLLPCSDL